MTAEERYHQLYEASPAAILTVDREGQVEDCNRAACTLLGRIRNELLGTPILRWIAQSDRPRSKTYFLKAFEGRTVDWSASVVRGDGTPRLIAFRAARRAEHAPTDPILVFLREDTGERPGRPEFTQLQTILENLPGQFVAVLDGTGRIRYSSGFARVLWFDDDSRLGREFATLLDEAGDSRVLLEALRQHTADGKQWDGLLWLQRADSELVPGRIFAVPYRDPKTSRVIGTLIVGRDVSEEREARAALGRAERHARIGELVVSIAQELKKPISRLDALTVQLRERLGDAGDTAIGPESGLSAEVARLGRLADALLFFARDVNVGRTATDLGALVAEVVAEQRHLVDGPIALSETIAPELPTAMVDSAQLRQVLRHLLANAREAVAGRAEAEIRVEIAATGGAIVIRVADDGPAVREDWLEQAFDPFFTTKPDHIGLGLSISRGVVAEHDGRIWIERDAEWTTVSIELPVDASASTTAFRPVPLVLCRARSVLVVDDDSAVRSLTRRFLEKVGYQVSEAWSGRSALAQLTSGTPPELVITDLKMKDGTGYWFLGQLSRDFPAVLRHTVIITGDPSTAAVEQLAKETGCPVVRKPFDFRVLLEALDEVALRS